MSELSYDRKSYATRLEEYIRSECYTHAMYKNLAGRCRGNMATALRSMCEDEQRHLKAMQMEYYLLTGDSLCCEKAEVEGDMCELLRRAYEGEGGAAEGYADEARLCTDEKLKKLYMAQSADETRHRAMVKKMLASIVGLI